MGEPESTLLSVVVVIVSDTTDRSADVLHLEPCLQALCAQTSPPPMEVIVAYLPPVEGIERLMRDFPNVRFVAVHDLQTHTGQRGGREHHDELRARGMVLARGRLIALLEDHGIVDQNWSIRIVEAHKQDFAAIGGAIENGVNRALNWAVYFCDFLRYQKPLPHGEAEAASDANISYKREALENISSVWRQIFHETVVNGALRMAGERLALSPEIVVYQYRRNLRFFAAMEERFIWGRSYAATRVNLTANASRKMLLVVLSPVLPALILGRKLVTVIKKRRRVGVFLRVFPLTALLTLSWSLGEVVGYLSGRAHAGGTPAADAITRR